MSLKERHPIHKSVDPPNRPPRKKDRLRKSILGLPGGLAAIEEDLPRYDVPAKEEEVRQRFGSQEPRVPMPGTFNPKQRATSLIGDLHFGRVQPTVPMPGSISGSKSASDLLAESAAFQVSNSPKFYEHIFHAKSFCTAFMCL